MSSERTAHHNQKPDQPHPVKRLELAPVEWETAVDPVNLSATLQRTLYDPHRGTSKEAATLQRTLGNRAVGQFFGYRAAIAAGGEKVGQDVLPDGKEGEIRPSLQTKPTPSQDTFFRSPAANHVDGEMRAQAQHRQTQHALVNPGEQNVVQRLPSNNNNPTMQPNGIYWNRQEMDGAWGNVPGRITAIMKKPGNGGVPSVAPPGWGWLQQKVGRLKGKWVRFHIINQYLGGPGNQTWNLVPTTVAVNGAYNREIEEDAKENAIDNNKWTYVDVQLVYNYNWPARVPSAVSAEWGSWNGNAWVAANAKVYQNYDITQFGMGSAYLRGHNITQAQATKRGVPARFAAVFTQWLQNYRQNDDDENDFQNAPDNHFNPDFLEIYNAGWLDQIWLDEDDTAPGKYQPVVKSL